MSLSELATALQALFDAYPTDADDAERSTLALAVEGGVEQHVVSLQPGHAVWLTDLVQKETTNTRNLHPDENGPCAHCNRYEVAGILAPACWIAWQLEGAGAGTPSLDEAAAEKYAETQYLDGLHPDDQAEASLNWTGGKDLHELEDNGQNTGWYVSPEEADAHTI